MVAAIGAVAAVGGAAISSSASRSAANQQSDSARQSTEAQQAAAAQTRADLAPWTQQGGAANSALGYRLGLNTGGGAVSASSAPALTYADLRNQLAAQFTRSTGSNAAGPAIDPLDSRALLGQQSSNDPYTDPSNWREVQISSGQGGAERVYTGPTVGSQIDEAGLDSEIRRRLADQDAATRRAQDEAAAAAQADPNYGSLLRAYRNGEEFNAGPAYDAGPAFSFTGQDLQNEPGYQFGLSQGEQGINRGQAARGNYLSGAALKELDRFNQDYAGTKYNEGFNRALTGYNTNQATNLNEYNTNLNARQNEWNTNLNAYNGNRDRIYNFLTGVSTLGQNSAAQTGASNQQAATQAGNNLLAAGNAQSAATIATGNSIQSGINGAVNAYRQPTGVNSASGWNQLLASQSGQSQNTGTNYLQSGYDATGMPNNI